jgi:Fe-S-cluster containining protein
MRRAIHKKDLETFASLDMAYNKIRVFQANHDATEFGCIGAGKCCKVGLKVHLSEAAHIAFRLRQSYYLIMEDKGIKAGEEWLAGKVDALVAAMHDESWSASEQTTDGHCAFWNNGCTIYGFRPMVCRAYGTITEVDSFCPRKRNDHDTIEHYAGEAVEETVKEFQLSLKKYAEDNGNDPQYDVVVYMPLGVLSFILEEDELIDLHKNTDNRMWEGFEGWFNYQSRFTRLHGLEESILLSEGKLRGFSEEELCNE